MKKRFLSICLLLCSAAYVPAQTPQLVYDIRPGGYSGSPTFLTAFQARLYFIAQDSAHGRELWSYDGINPPTLTADINPGIQSSGGYETDQHMAVLGGKLYFPADNGITGVELYSYDGINPPAVAADIRPGPDPSYPLELMVAGSKLYFIALDATGRRLYSYNAAAGAVPADTLVGMDIGAPTNLAAFNGKIYFTGRISSTGYELFSYNPATNACALAADINPGGADGYPECLKVIDNKLWFSAFTSSNVRQLYSFDGSTATCITSTLPGMQVSAITARFDTLGHTLFFSGDTAALSSMLLCKYDMAAGGMSIVKGAYGQAAANEIIAYNNSIYYTAHSMGSGIEIWVSDGDTTLLLADIYPGSSSSHASDFYEWNNALYLVANDGVVGYELFRVSEVGVGIRNVAFDGEACLYPNPATGATTIRLSLKAANDLFVTLQDVSGRLVYHSGTAHYAAGTSIIHLPLSDLSPGCYLYTLRSAGGRLLSSGRVLNQ